VYALQGYRQQGIYMTLDARNPFCSPADVYAAGFKAEFDEKRSIIIAFICFYLPGYYCVSVLAPVG
jgi:hypothetical protein